MTTLDNPFDHSRPTFRAEGVMIKSCRACGATFTPKIESHPLCKNCWLWLRAGKNIRTTVAMISKAKEV